MPLYWAILSPKGRKKPVFKGRGTNFHILNATMAGIILKFIIDAISFTPQDKWMFKTRLFSKTSFFCRPRCNPSWAELVWGEEKAGTEHEVTGVNWQGYKALQCSFAPILHVQRIRPAQLGLRQRPSSGAQSWQGGVREGSGHKSDALTPSFWLWLIRHYLFAILMLFLLCF